MLPVLLLSNRALNTMLAGMAGRCGDSTKLAFSTSLADAQRPSCGYADHNIQFTLFSILLGAKKIKLGVNDTDNAWMDHRKL